MKSTARIITLSIISLAIAGHFTILSIHALYPNKYSFYYTYPFFQQNWNLFVPAPSENYDLYCIYLKQNKETKRNLAQELLNAHKTNSVSGNELLLTGLMNSIHYYKNEPNAVNLKVLEYFTKRVIEDSENSEITKLKLILVVSPVDSLPPRVYHTFSK